MRHARHDRRARLRHAAPGVGYVDYLVSHEVCHQWWYNLVGTNGYCETWMDEALATFFSNKLQNQKYGHNNDTDLVSARPGMGAEHPPRRLPLVQPVRLHWPRRELSGRAGDAEVRPSRQSVQHVLRQGVAHRRHDRGAARPNRASSASCGVIYKKYQYRILRVADYQHELEAFTADTHGDWDRFFKQWLYGVGLSDWAVEKVEVHDCVSPLCPTWLPAARSKPFCRSATIRRIRCVSRCISSNAARSRSGPRSASRCPVATGYPIRVPIIPDADAYHLDEPPCDVIPHDKNEVRVEIQLPAEPEQIAVDPDQVLVDTNPANNFWKPPIRWRVTPIYTFLEETDLTNAYDRWNVIVGPWVYGTAYNDAWYTRSTMFGARAGSVSHAGFRRRRVCGLSHGLPRRGRRRGRPVGSLAVESVSNRLQRRTATRGGAGRRESGRSCLDVRTLRVRAWRQPLSAARALRRDVRGVSGQFLSVRRRTRRRGRIGSSMRQRWG